MEQNITCDIVSLRVRKNVVGYRWIFTIKYNADGTIKRYKGLLVAQGFTQQEGIDYLDIFSHVANLTSVKLLFSLAVIKDTLLMLVLFFHLIRFVVSGSP